MNRVLVTGLAIGRELDLCGVCNYDYDWLIAHPSVLIWADSILVTKSVWDVVQAEVYPDPGPVAKSCKLVLDIARAHGVLEVREPAPLDHKGVRERVTAQASRDLDAIAEMFPDRVKVETHRTTSGQDHRIMRVDGSRCCIPAVSAMYYSLALARAWGAHCLFDADTLTYLRYKFGISGFPREVDSKRGEAFRAVFESHLPSYPLLPNYACGHYRCQECPYRQGCADTYLAEVESNTQAVLRWREYDEVCEVRKVVGDIVDHCERVSGPLDLKDVAAEFEERKRALRHRLEAVFPKVRRWCSVATMVSVPLAILGVSTALPLAAVPGAVGGGLATLTREAIEFLESKYRWVGFLDDLSG